jgi:uncharacterized glyoxalase superfamily protein PhnB
MTNMTTEETAALVAATPVLPSLDIARTVAFWHTEDAELPKASGCRIQVKGIDALYSHCHAAGIVHPNAPLVMKPWGTREFAILDPDGNCLTFHQSDNA